MLAYFPFQDDYHLAVEAVPLRPGQHLFDVDASYRHDVALRRELLEHERAYHFDPGSSPSKARWDVLGVVTAALAAAHPESFALERTASWWRWENRLLGEELTFRFDDDASLPLDPLEWIGRQVQEDLLLLADEAGATLRAGHLCFPNGWCLKDKMDQSFLGVHRPVPALAGSVLAKGGSLMERLRTGRTVWRASWNFKTTDRLELSPRHDHADWMAESAAGINEHNIAERLWVRIERQTFTRLERSRMVLFGIHTYNSPLGEESRDLDRARRMLGTLRTTPAEMRHYKRLDHFLEPLLVFLETRMRSGEELR